MQGKNLLTGLVLAVLLLICGLAGAKAWAEATGPGVPAQQVGSTWVTTTPSQAAATSSQGAAATSSQGAAATGSSEGTKAPGPATAGGQQAAEPEDGGSDSGGGG